MNTEDDTLEQKSEDSETELLMEVSAEELKSMLENLVESRLSSLQVSTTFAWSPFYMLDLFYRRIWCQN